MKKLNANTVGGAAHSDPLNQKGITLIALIITIIVMLILVGVTINVALNGGLFNKAEVATTKTKITQIQEALTIKRGEVLADYKGKAPENYGIELKDLNLPEELKTEYGSKLIISKEGKLYYDASVVTNEAEQNHFKSMGINEYVIVNKLNAWQERGLTAPVQYDVKYTVTHSEYGTNEVIIESSGGLTITSSEGTENYDAENVIEEHGMIVPIPNGNTLQLYGGDSFLVIVDSNTIKLYIGEVSESSIVLTLTPVIED